MTLTHWNDGDTAMKKWPVGSIIPKGQIICYEGTNVNVPLHIHMTCGRGYSSGWQKSTTGKQVITGDGKPPEDVLYINPSFTKIGTRYGKNGLNWRNTPSSYGTPVTRNNTIRQVNVIATMQDAYSSVGGSSIGLVNPGIYNLLQVSGEYVQIESGLWVKLISGKVVILEAEVVPSTLNSINDTRIGSSINIIINKKTSSAYYTLRYIFKSTNATIATNVDSSYQFNLSKNLYYHMTDSKFANNDHIL